MKKEDYKIYVLETENLSDEQIVSIMRLTKQIPIELTDEEFKEFNLVGEVFENKLSIKDKIFYYSGISVCVLGTIMALIHIIFFNN